MNIPILWLEKKGPEFLLLLLLVLDSVSQSSVLLLQSLVYWDYS